jgi:hypothetical protein
MRAILILFVLSIFASAAYAQRKRAAQPGFASFVISYPNTKTIERKPLTQTQAEVKNNMLNIAFSLADGVMLQLNGIPVSLIADTMLHTNTVKIVCIGQESTMVSDRAVKLTIRQLEAGADKQVRIHAIGRVADKKNRQTFELQYVGLLPAEETIKEYRLEIKE